MARRWCAKTGSRRRALLRSCERLLHVEMVDHRHVGLRQRLLQALLKTVTDGVHSMVRMLADACLLFPTATSGMQCGCWRAAHLVRPRLHVLICCAAFAHRVGGNMRLRFRHGDVHRLRAKGVVLAQTLQPWSLSGGPPVARHGAWDLQRLLWRAAVLVGRALLVREVIRPSESALIPVACISFSLSGVMEGLLKVAKVKHVDVCVVASICAGCFVAFDEGQAT